MNHPIHGVLAALLTPRPADTTVDSASLEALVTALKQRGIAGFVVNGATGEYCLTTPAELRTMLRCVRKAGGDDVQLVCGVGGPGMAQVLELASVAAEYGADALLLPPPHFFPYQQDDLDVFYRAAAAAVEGPVIIYNIPQFTSPVNVGTARSLIHDVPKIIGIKDSSGSLEILRALTHTNAPACRIVGNDAALPQAVREGVCDAVISGVACVLPELVQAIFNHAGSAENPANLLLGEFLRAIDEFPVPWGLRWAAEAAGLVPSWSSQPVSPRRAERAAHLKTWFKQWHPAVSAHVGATAMR